MPFGELAWDHTRRGLGQGASEEEIADAVAALLRRAGEGPEENGKLGGVDAVDEAEDGLCQLLGGLHRGVVADAVELDGTDPR